jgi:hypothetical protein
MSAKEVRRTARSLAKSLDSVHKGLTALLHSLERGGFKQAASSYNEMQLVLIQQRLWSEAHRRTELDARWQRVATVSAGIYDILAPFAAAMEELRTIDRIRPAEDPPGDEHVDELAGLLLEGLRVSNAQLMQHAVWSEEERRSRMNELVNAGIVERHGWGRSMSYRLTPAARRQMAAAMTKIMDTDQHK